MSDKLEINRVMSAENSIISENKSPRGGLFIRKQDGSNYIRQIRARSRMRTAKCRALKAIRKKFFGLKKLDSEFLFVLRKGKKSTKLLIAGHDLLVDMFITVLPSVHFEPFILDSVDKNTVIVRTNENNTAPSDECPKEDQGITNRKFLGIYSNDCGRKTRSSSRGNSSNDKVTVTSNIRKRTNSESMGTGGNKVFKVEVLDDAPDPRTNPETAEIDEVDVSETDSLEQSKSGNETERVSCEKQRRIGKMFLRKTTGTPEMLLHREKTNKRTIKCKLKKSIKKLLVKLNDEYLFILREGTLRNYVISGSSSLMSSFLEAYPCVNLKPLYESDVITLDECLNGNPQRNDVEIISPTRMQRGINNASLDINHKTKVSTLMIDHVQPISSEEFTNLCQNTEVDGTSCQNSVKSNSSLTHSYGSNMQDKKSSAASASTVHYQDKEMAHTEKYFSDDEIVHGVRSDQARGKFMEFPLLNEVPKETQHIQKDSDKMSDISASEDKLEHNLIQLNRMDNTHGNEVNVRKHQYDVLEEDDALKISVTTKETNYAPNQKKDTPPECDNDLHNEKVQHLCRFCGSKKLNNASINETKLSFAEEFQELYSIDVNEEDFHPALICRGHQMMFHRYRQCQKERRIFRTFIRPVAFSYFQHKSDTCTICTPINPFLRLKKPKHFVQVEIIRDFTPKQDEMKINPITECFSNASASERLEFLESIVDKLTQKEKLCLGQQIENISIIKPLRNKSKCKETQTRDSYISEYSNKSDSCSLHKTNSVHVSTQTVSKSRCKNKSGNKYVYTRKRTGGMKCLKKITVLKKNTSNSYKAKAKHLLTNQHKKQPVNEMKCHYANGEYIALRNKEGGFYICKLLQNVFGHTKSYRVFWMEQLLGDLYKLKKPGSISHDLACVITHCKVKKVDVNLYELESGERNRIENVLRNHPKNAYIDFVTDNNTSYIGYKESKMAVETNLPYQKQGKEIDEIKINISNAFQIKEEEADSGEEVDAFQIKQEVDSDAEADD